MNCVYCASYDIKYHAVINDDGDYEVKIYDRCECRACGHIFDDDVLEFDDGDYDEVKQEEMTDVPCDFLGTKFYSLTACQAMPVALVFLTCLTVLLFVGLAAIIVWAQRRRLK